MYKVLYQEGIYHLGTGIKVLEEKINELLAEGWEVTGGISIVITGKSSLGDQLYTCSQAIIKKQINTEEVTQ